jgi:hypothetical protein
MFRWCRRWSWCLLWLALVLLPVRGWALAAMQVPAVADSAAAVATMPCHGEAPAADVAESAEAAAAAHACHLCDLCHSAALPVAVAGTAGRYLPPQVAVAVPLPLEGARQTFFRPPRA